MYLPDWIVQYKEPRTEIRLIKEKYYKYEVRYQYNKTKKRTEKITVRLLGRITREDGFIPSSKDTLRREKENLPQVDIKTFGIYKLFSSLMEEEIETVKTVFGREESERLLSFSMMRWAYQTPIKRAPFYHSHDFCSEFWSRQTMNDKHISLMLRQVGENRQKAVDWMRSLLKGIPEEDQHFVMMDSTHAASRSENLGVNAKGYNSNFDYTEQIRLMYIFSASLKQPVYYRMINGNIPDVKSMSLCMEEFNMEDLVYIADKGFYSESNIKELESEHRRYIIPLRRNNPLIDYSALQEMGFKRNMHYFMYQKRTIWYYIYQKSGMNLITFLDEQLRVKEENDYLSRVESHPENFSKKAFDEKLHQFGTLTMLYNFVEPQKTSCRKKKTEKGKQELAKPETVYATYKHRNEVEIMFDSYKNYLDADLLYMQNRYVLEGWLFANFIAMIAYYRLYSRLKTAELLSKHSPKDIIELSKAIYKTNIRGVWKISEITKKATDLFKKVGIDYLN